MSSFLPRQSLRTPIAGRQVLIEAVKRRHGATYICSKRRTFRACPELAEGYAVQPFAFLIASRPQSALGFVSA